MLRRAARTLAVIAFVSGLFATPRVRADETADEADFRFRRAAELYGKGRVDEALGEFYASNRLVRNKNVTFNIARCLEQLGDVNEAYRYYNDLTAEAWADDDRAALEQSLARLKPKVALVRVETTPPGAEVFVEREDLGLRGLAPKVLALPPGQAKVIVQLAGHRRAERVVTLAKGQETVAAFELEFIHGTLVLETKPAGAQVRLGTPDAAIACVTPCRLEVPPGLTLLHLDADGHQHLRREVEVAPDAEVVLPLALAPRPAPTGSLVVTANRENALVFIDGREAGFTPAVVNDVVVGTHEVEVRFEDLEPWKGTVEIVEGRPASVRARLSVPAPQVAAASKTLASADDAPASVTVITGEELRAFGYRSVAEALRAVRGVYVTNDRNYDYLGVRGFAPPGDYNARVTLLVDGHPMNEVWSNYAAMGVDLDVDLADVERIEVLRGPNSVIYGSSAVYGVVNVVRRQRPAKGVAELVTSAGNLGTLRGRATAGAGGEGWSVKASAAAAGIQGADVTQLQGGPGAAPVATVFGLDREQAAQASVFARLGDFSLVGNWSDRTKQLPTAPWDTLVGVAGTFSRERRGFAELRWEKSLGGFDLSARGYWDTYTFDGDWMYPEIGAQTDLYRADWTGAEVRVRSPAFAGQRLSLAAEGQLWLDVFWRTYNAQEEIENQRFPGASFSASALWDGQFGPGLGTEAGVRVDKQATLDAPVLSPRAALLARPYDGGRTKVLFGRAFRAPNVNELHYTDGGITQVPGNVTGPLPPETLTSLEVEHTHRISEELKATVSVWGSQLVDRIVLAPYDTGSAELGTKLKYQTDQAIAAVGAEAEVRWQPSRLVLVSFAWAYQYSRPGADFLKAPAIVNSPAHLGTLRAMMPLHPLVTLAAEATYGSARWTSGTQLDGTEVQRFPVGEALLVGAALSGELVKDRLRYNLLVQNLLDEQYSYPVGDEVRVPAVQQYGRQVHLTLVSTF